MGNPNPGHHADDDVRCVADLNALSEDGGVG